MPHHPNTHTNYNAIIIEKAPPSYQMGLVTPTNQDMIMTYPKTDTF